MATCAPTVQGDPISVNDDGTLKTSGGQTSNTGIEDTFLRSGAAPTGGVSNSAAARLFDVPGVPDPSQTTELMTKIFSNVTNRSNVFAVWVTVGFFRVPPGAENLRPVPLAEEINASTGTNIRHRLFAVVDRSRTTLARRSLTTLTGAVTQAQLYQPAGVPVTVAAASGNITTGSTPIPWQIQTGSR